MEGHAFPAVWLIDERFPEGIVEDAARLRNLIALGQLLPFDVSTAVSAGHPPLDRAVAVARQHLEDDARFRAALDVNILRADRYRPLPLRAVEPPAPELPSPEPADSRIRAILESAAAAPQPSDDKPPAPQVVSRFGRWKEKLLDLTLRNRLLNFRSDTRGALPLQVPDLGAFEDVFSTGEAFELMPAPEEDSRDMRAAKSNRRVGWRRSSPSAASWTWPGASSTRRCARPSCGLACATWTGLPARTWKREGPTRSIWPSACCAGSRRETPPSASRPCCSTLPRSRLTGTASVSVSVREADEPLGNVTLAEKLKLDYGLDASALTSLEADDNGLDVAAILRAVRKAIQSRAGWEVLEEAHAGLFTFTKFLMWKDLADNEEVLLSNPLVRHIAAAGAPAPPFKGRNSGRSESTRRCLPRSCRVSSTRTPRRWPRWLRR